MVYLDTFVAHYVDLLVWEYCKDQALYIMAIPNSICCGQRAFNIAALSRYTKLMLFYMQHR